MAMDIDFGPVAGQNTNMDMDMNMGGPGMGMGSRPGSRAVSISVEVRSSTFVVLFEPCSSLPDCLDTRNRPSSAHWASLAHQLDDRFRLWRCWAGRKSAKLIPTLGIWRCWCGRLVRYWCRVRDGRCGRYGSRTGRERGEHGVSHLDTSMSHV